MMKSQMESYRTVLNNVSIDFEERKSRFIAHVCPVTMEEEAVSFINNLKTRYWDATHNVYAYCVGEGSLMAVRYSDDGEPQGTAGLPVLEVIKKNSLRDVCIVVTRYFGGIMLGAPGLVRAYGKSASLGVEASEIVEMIPCDVMEVTVEYNFSDKIRYVLNQQDYIIDDIEFGQDVKIKVMVPIGRVDFSPLMTDITSGACLIEKTGEGYFARSLQNDSEIIK
jgi:uncharacterized YigZ family protein